MSVGAFAFECRSLNLGCLTDESNSLSMMIKSLIDLQCEMSLEWLFLFFHAFVIKK